MTVIVNRMDSNFYEQVMRSLVCAEKILKLKDLTALYPCAQEMNHVYTELDAMLRMGGPDFSLSVGTTQSQSAKFKLEVANMHMKLIELIKGAETVLSARISQQEKSNSL